VTPWTPERERCAIVAHLARCSFCRALVEHSRRRQDRELLDAAREHAECEQDWPGLRAGGLATAFKLRRQADGPAPVALKL